MPSARASAPAASPASPTRATTLARLRQLEAGEVALAVCPPLVPEGALFGDGGPWRFGIAIAGEVLVGDCAGPAEVLEALGDRPIVAHDAKALGVVPATLAFDTLIAAYLLDPARRGYPLSELCEDRGIDPGQDERAAWDAAAVATLAAAQRPELEQRELRKLI